MKVRAGVGEPDRLAVLLHVGKDEDVGVLGMVELIDDVRLRLAELPGEREKARRREPLPRNTSTCEAKNAFHTLPKSGSIVSASAPNKAASSTASVHRQKLLHARAGERRVHEKARSIRQAEEFERCWMLRADCWPPTMTKWSWWPFSHAMNTTPVL